LEAVLKGGQPKVEKLVALEMGQLELGGLPQAVTLEAATLEFQHLKMFESSLEVGHLVVLQDEEPGDATLEFQHLKMFEPSLEVGHLVVLQQEEPGEHDNSLHHISFEPELVVVHLEVDKPVHRFPFEPSFEMALGVWTRG